MKEQLTIEQLTRYNLKNLLLSTYLPKDKNNSGRLFCISELIIRNNCVRGVLLDKAHKQVKYSLKYVKPILYPLSDLTKEEWKEEILIYFVDLDIDIRVYNSGNYNKNDFTLSITYKLIGETFTTSLIQRGFTRETPRHFYEWLLQNHFDVDNLIQKGLAIDVNTLENNPYE